MKRHTSRSVVIALGILLLVAVPTQAGPLEFADAMVRTLNGEQGQQSINLELRSLAQIAAQIQNDQKSSPVAAGDGPGPSLTSVLVAPMQDGDVVELGEITGTVCDCGEIPLEVVADITGTVCDCGQIPLGIIAAAGLPKLPFLALAALPLAFIDIGGDDNPVQTIISTPETPLPPAPPPAPEPIPEPATMFLFGSGLLGLSAHTSRRRRARRSSETAKTEAGRS